MIEVTKEQANDIYDLLIEEVGCPNDDHSRFSFVKWLTDPQYIEAKNMFGGVFTIEKGREFRIGCRLGFGGKFWNSNGRLYINCYREDEFDIVRSTGGKENRADIIERVNKRLEEFYG